MELDSYDTYDSFESVDTFDSTCCCTTDELPTPDYPVEDAPVWQTSDDSHSVIPTGQPGGPVVEETQAWATPEETMVVGDSGSGSVIPAGQPGGPEGWATGDELTTGGGDRYGFTVGPEVSGPGTMVVGGGDPYGFTVGPEVSGPGTMVIGGGDPYGFTVGPEAHGQTSMTIGGPYTPGSFGDSMLRMYEVAYASHDSRALQLLDQIQASQHSTIDAWV